MSLRTVMQRTATFASRRFAFSTAATPLAPGVPNMYKYSFKKAFLSDPSTYPLIAIMACAGSFLVGMSINALNYRNVKINPKLKQVLIPEKTPHRTAAIEVFARAPIIIHPEVYRQIQKEGLGVDHEEWKKRREADLEI